jgi:hypothetical protein
MIKRQDAVHLAYRSAIAMMAWEHALDPAELMEKNLQGGKCLASTLRQRAIYLTVIGFDVPLSQAAVAAGVTKQAVSKALRRIEDEREDPKIDALLTRLEVWLTGVAP